MKRTGAASPRHDFDNLPLQHLGALKVDGFIRDASPTVVTNFPLLAHRGDATRAFGDEKRATTRRFECCSQHAPPGSHLPAVRGSRERVASPDEAIRLLDALERDRALRANAMSPVGAGLRR